MSLKELRKEKGLTQKEVSKILNIPLRTYIRYESDEQKIDTLKYNYLVEKLQQITMRFYWIALCLELFKFRKIATN